LFPPGREPNSRSGAVTTVTLAIQVAAQIEDLFVVVVVKWLAGFSWPAARMAVWPA